MWLLLGVRRGCGPLTLIVRPHVATLKNKHTWIALLAAVVVAAVVFALVVMLREPCNGVVDCALGFGVFALIVFQFAFLIAVFIGLPVYMLFRHFSLYRWWQYATGGLGIAGMGWYLFGLTSQSLVVAATCAGMGVAAASTFWLMAPWKHEA